MTEAAAQAETTTPPDEREAARILAEAASEGRTVRVEGRGTRVHRSPGEGPRGSPEDRPALRMSSSALEGVESYEPADLVMTVRAGTPLSHVRKVAAAEGQWVALDPPGGGQRSVGGAVAGGEYGPLHAGLGLPREQVLAARVATSDGRLLTLGAPVVKNVAGFDLLKLLPGSRGRLGLVTAITLRLHPVPPEERTFIFQEPDPAEAARIARRLAEAPVSVLAFELLVRCPEADEAGAAVAIHVAGRGSALDAVERSLEAAGGRAASQVLGPEATHGFFEALSRAEGAVTRPAHLMCPPARVPDAVEGLEAALAESAAPGPGSAAAPTPVRVHVLGGRLRLAPEAPAVPDAQALLSDVAERLRQKEPQAAHGPGAASRRPGPPSSDEGGVARLVSGIRKVFDPQGVLVDPGSPWREMRT